ncbi:L-threonylcarbamoyladenylate synthase [Tessaracoccus caeni]|uniref:L-threonylcarbamoyladenylate synthase n=1 Tax=Tessaracoccus caeni TaxID=3031239 RepID=UPI0023DBC07A|nr:L-threonylcarbamoyladenylate synthase [Tessaracoccus caeni]MDF1490125.1 L-threonylcarbamoyladenylate synthase [Tessaracoccus caeni]
MTEHPTTFSLADDAQGGYAAAAAAVSEGQCIVLPTDTVYGIGADAFSADAVQGLLDAKRRGKDMPPPVLIAERLMMRAVVTSVPAAADELAKAFWPGALTLILKAQPAARLQLGETHGTVAIRVPDHDGARELLRRTGPLAVSSANVSGEPPATSCADAEAQLGDSVAVYLDGGQAAGGVASTIVDFTRFEHGEVVRLGALSLEQLQEVSPGVVLPVEPEPEPESTESEPADSDSDPAEPEATDDEPTEVLRDPASERPGDTPA